MSNNECHVIEETVEYIGQFNRYKWSSTHIVPNVSELIFSSPDPKGHVSYSHHLASVVRHKLFQKSSPLKVLDQWKPNLV